MIFLKRTCIGICNISCKIIHIIDGISEFRNFIDHIMQFCKFLNLLIGRFQSHNCLKNCFCCTFVDSHSCILHSFEDHFCHIGNRSFIKAFVVVPCECFFISLHGNFLIFINKLADRIQGICHIRNTKSLRAGKVINCSTLLCCKATGQTVIYHGCKERKRTSLCMCNIDCIICIDHQRNTVFHLFLVCIIEFVESIHLGNIASLNANLYTLVHTICKNKFQWSAHIKECSIMPSFCFTCFLRFYTANDIVVPGIFQR